MAMDTPARRLLPVLGVVLSGALLSGCAGIKDRGAEVYDRALEESEFVICRAASVGSVMRKYGGSPEMAAAWKTLCTANPDAVDSLFGVKRAPEGEG